MYGKKHTLVLILVLVILMLSGCSVNNELEGQESVQGKAQGSTSIDETPAQITVTPQEDVDGPGGMTPFGPEQDPLFDFYSIPADWPRVVPLMTEFQVTNYEWSDNELYAAGYGNVSISRANNYYTNVQKKHVSSNIWEQDPSAPSVTEGTRQVFNYIGEGHALSVTLIESSNNSLYFELFFYPAP